MKNKKGFLLGEETLKIIVAVICIGFLIYLLAALYFSKVNSQKTVEAQLTLMNSSSASIRVIIDRVNMGQGNIDGNSENALIHNPSGWNLMSFVESGKRPNSCLGKNCLCICDGVIDDLVFIKDRQLKECDEDGACLVVENLAAEKINIGISENTELNIKKENNLVYIKKI